MRERENSFKGEYANIKSEIDEFYYKIMSLDEITDIEAFGLNIQLSNINNNFIMFLNNRKNFFSEERKSIKKKIIVLIILKAISLFFHPILLFIISFLLIKTSFELLSNTKKINELNREWKTFELEIPKLQNALTNCMTFINKKNRKWKESKNRKWKVSQKDVSKESQKGVSQDNECLADIINLANFALDSYLQGETLIELDEKTKNVLVMMIQDNLETDEMSLEKLLQMVKEKEKQQKLEEGQKLVRFLPEIDEN